MEMISREDCVKRIVALGSILTALLFAASLTVQAQDSSGASLSKLEAKASKTVDVTMDKSMLQFAALFLNVKDADQAKAKKIVAKLRGVYVHSFEFEKEGGYSAEDIAPLRAALKEPEWSRIVNVHSKQDGENTEVYFKKVDGKFQGLVVIATQPKQLTYVNIDGEIDPEDLSKLGGQFGIPRIDVDHSDKKGEDK
jgi:hypothetical protein